MPGKIKFRVYVDFPGLGETEVFPLNDSVRYGWKREDGIWRKFLPTKLAFINTKGTNPHAFDIMAALELQPCGCHKLPMRLKLICGADEHQLFEGWLYFIDGEWQFDICQVEIEPRVSDPFECLFQAWEAERNIMTVSPQQNVNIDTGNFERVTCFDLLDQSFESSLENNLHNIYNDTCLSSHDGGDWTVLMHMVQKVDVNSNGGGPEGRTQWVTEWIREVWTGPGDPPGDGWTQVNSGLWTRVPVLQGPTVFHPTYENNPNLMYQELFNVMSMNIDNGRLLSDVIKFLFNSCQEYPVRSDFFGIDPINDHPYNSAYVYAKEWIYGALVFSTSDIVKVQAFENAIIANVSLKNLLDRFKEFFKVYLFFDEINGCYRIEHNSYRSKDLLINLVKKRPDALRGYNSYTYIKERIPQKEVFSFKYETKDEDWDNSTIIYPDCHDTGRVEETEIDIFHTDLGSLIGSELENIDFLKGITIVSSRAGYVRRNVGDISGRVKANASLSWANIVKHLHRWDMPACSAMVNGDMSDFVSVIPKIKQADFSAELCCEDILMLDPARCAIRTGFGNGEIHDQIEGDLSSGLFDFSLVFRPPVEMDKEDGDLEFEISVDPDDDEICTDFSVTFSLIGNVPHGTVLSWHFGEGAIPLMANGIGPHEVFYSSDGVKEVTVTGHYFGQTFTATTTITMIICV